MRRKEPYKKFEKMDSHSQGFCFTYHVKYIKYQFTDLTITEQPPGFSISGTMWMCTDSTVQQTLTINREVENYFDEIVKIPNGSVMILGHGLAQYQIKYSFDRVNFHLFFEEIDEAFGPVKLTEEWKRISFLFIKICRLTPKNLTATRGTEHFSKKSFEFIFQK